MRPQAHTQAQAEDRVLQGRTTLRDEEPDNGAYVVLPIAVTPGGAAPQMMVSALLGRWDTLMESVTRWTPRGVGPF
jgi:hypothetical protein